jgi:hypothetical protein
MNLLNKNCLFIRNLVFFGGSFMAISFLNVGCSLFGIRSEESPKYEVLQVEGKKEIRSYSKYIVAKTVVKGDYREAQGEAFRLLAGYIFGKNEKKQSLAMTAPVVQEKSKQNQKLAMTAPVAQSPTEEGWVMTFMMPSQYKLGDLPTPLDKRVTLEEVPPKTLGVIGYSGSRGQSKNEKKAAELKAWLLSNGKYEIVSEPISAGYDPPWTLPFFRRNEMMFELKSKE